MPRPFSLLLNKFWLLGFSVIIVWILIIVHWLYTLPVIAGTDPISIDSPVTATVPTFSTGQDDDTTPPSIPILIRPSDRAVTADSTPEFVWYQSSDPNSNFVAYTVYLDGIATYLGVSSSGNGIGNGYTSFIEDSQVRLTPTTPLIEGVHTWQVVAYDMANNQASSTIWSFVIDLTPPPITITDIDTYHNLNLNSVDPSSVPDGTTFDIAGPNDVYFTLTTETYTNVNLTITDLNGEIIYISSQATGNYTNLTFFVHLPIGSYLVYFSGTDHVGLVSVVPPFALNVFSPSIVVPIPGISPPPTFDVPPVVYNLPSSIYNYPATIARIATRPDLSLICIPLLAIGILLLLILLWRRFNLLIIDARNLKDKQLILTHSYPNPKNSKELVTEMYHIPDYARYRLYLPHLSRFSSLTLSSTYLKLELCLSVKKRRYTVVIDP